MSDGQKHTVVLLHCSSTPSFGYFGPYFLPDLAERAWPRQTGTCPARNRAGLSRSPPTESAIPVQGVALAETDGDGPCKEPRLLTGGRTGRRETRGLEWEDRAGMLTGGGWERRYGEAPSRAVREGGREMTRSLEEVRRDLPRGSAI